VRAANARRSFLHPVRARKRAPELPAATEPEQE
jgi:hypothetical protein